MDRTVSWWSLDDHDPAREFDTFWPGWTLRTMGDDFEWYENVTGCMMRDWGKEIAQFGEMVEQSMGCGSRGDPLLRLNEILAESGENASLSSFDFDFAQKTERADFILAYLDHLESHVVLPPARFIDRHGDVVPPLRRSHPRR